MIRLKRLYAHDFKQLKEVDLTFPEAGRVLIQGKNEAGKSTLFEAVFFALFGQGLATETGRANLEDLIGYEKGKARIELDLYVQDRLFRIIRTLNRGKPNVWQLDIQTGEQIEEIRGNQAVNRRLVAELGFDAEALLNTCFVEQKKLEKLEGMTKARREESLLKLLNLDRLLEVGEKLKLRGEDENLLARLSQRVELGRVQQELPIVEQDLIRVEGQLKLLELKIQVHRALEEKRAAVELRDQLADMQTRREQLRTAVKRVDALDKARQSIGGALDRHDLVRQQSSSLEALRRERTEIDEAVRENLPALERRSRELGRLLHHLAHINQVEAARGTAVGELQRVQATQLELDSYLQRGADLNQAIAEFEVRSAKLEQLVKNYDRGEALGEWAAAKREANRDVETVDSLDARARARSAAQARLRAGLIAPGIVLIALIGATVFVPLALLFLTRNAALAAGSGAVLLLVDAALAAWAGRRALESWNELEQATAELAQAEGAAAARQEIAASLADRLAAAEKKLAELDLPIPASTEAAESRRIELAATLENKTREELNAERETVREQVNYARAQRDETAKRIQELQSLAAGMETAAQDQRVIDKAGRLLARWQPFLARRAAGLEVEPEYQTVREARLAIEGDRKNWATRIEQARQLGNKIAEAEKLIRRVSGEMRASYEPARNLLNGRTPEWQPDLPRSVYEEMADQLGAAFAAEGGEQVRSQLNALEKEVGACERELKLRSKAENEALVRAMSIMTELGLGDEPTAEADLEQLENLAHRLAAIQDQDQAPLEARVRSLTERVGALRQKHKQLEQALGLQGEIIDLQLANEELAREQGSQQERRYGTEIVLRAQKRIMQQVLPATMDYMVRILPQLTRDRYHDAKLDAETYKIRVWDERAGGSGDWKEKNIFSGGTKDQFSLALRLAFALATLPQERGTYPGFIFLDEPLGSFDEERAAALLYLLTEGEIGRAFDQIFLISHVRVQEDRFTHHVRLEDGATVESSLSSS